MTNDKSRHYPYANLELDWFPTDTKELYELNLKNNFIQLETNGWIDYKKFTYKFNSLGFRSDEFTEQPSAMFLGCSYVLGTGLSKEHRWTEILSNYLNLNCANLGIAGCGPDTCFRLCYHYIDIVKPKILIYMTPPDARFEIIKTDKIIQLMASLSFPKEYFEYYKINTEDDCMYFYNSEKNRLAIQHLCESRNIKFLPLTHDIVEYIDLARDLSHAGINSNIKVVNYILENFNL